MSKNKIVCYWVKPDGTEHRGADGFNCHLKLLRAVEGLAKITHECAFEQGFLRIVVLGDGFSAQWQGTLTSVQRSACTRLAEDCSFIEISGASDQWDPEGKSCNFSLVREDSQFRRTFAACLRRKMNGW